MVPEYLKQVGMMVFFSPPWGWFRLIWEMPETTMEESPIESRVYSISELTRRIRTTLERVVGAVWIEGEVSNLSYQPSGHVYFTLKDANSQLGAVMFRSEASRMRFRLKEGMLVQGFGRITVYEKRGNYQIILETVQETGKGNLQAAFERLKRKLEGEGLFAPARKRALPVFPGTVGLITSPTGAAIRDFCRVLHRRFPGIRIVVAPTRVQGDGAAQEIAAAVELLNIVAAGADPCSIDVIAIVRGGGSIEDLWAFNEEVVARAVARSKVPTISGVGHEIDFTICDFVADVRAATPSMAAEMIIRPRDEYLGELRQLARSLYNSSRLALGARRDLLIELRESLRQQEPRVHLRQVRQRLDEAASALQDAMRRHLSNQRERWQQAAHRMQELTPKVFVERKRSTLQHLKQRMEAGQARLFSRVRHRLELGSQRLELLSPNATLARGYSITLDEISGKVVRSTRMAKVGMRLTTRFPDGVIKSRVED